MIDSTNRMPANEDTTGSVERSEEVLLNVITANLD